jgi:hypothetical protein
MHYICAVMIAGNQNNIGITCLLLAYNSNQQTNKALPQTDEACFGCGSDRQFMTSSGRTRLR